MLLNNECVKKEIKKEFKKVLETNKSDITIQNLWDAAKAVLRGKFIAIQAYLKKIKTFQTNNLTLRLLLRTRGTTTKTAQSKQKEGNNQDQSRTK